VNRQQRASTRGPLCFAAQGEGKAPHFGQPPDKNQTATRARRPGREGRAWRCHAAKRRPRSGELLEHHEWHDAVEIALRGAAAARVAVLQREDPELEEARASHGQEHSCLRDRPDQVLTHARHRRPSCRCPRRIWAATPQPPQALPPENTIAVADERGEP
jgi:hypothetical protein